MVVPVEVLLSRLWISPDLQVGITRREDVELRALERWLRFTWLVAQHLLRSDGTADAVYGGLLWGLITRHPYPYCLVRTPCKVDERGKMRRGEMGLMISSPKLLFRPGDVEA